MRVIDEDGSQLGVMPLEEARHKAREKRLDLVEVAPSTRPPVIKITDFRSFLAKYLKQAKGGRKRSGQHYKQIRLKPFVDEHDLETKLERMGEFLSQGHKVKVTVYFYGRTITHKHLGEELMEKIMSRFQDQAKLELGPILKGKRLIAVFMSKKQ